MVFLMVYARVGRQEANKTDFLIFSPIGKLGPSYFRLFPSPFYPQHSSSFRQNFVTGTGDLWMMGQGPQICSVLWFFWFWWHWAGWHLHDQGTIWSKLYFGLFAWDTKTFLMQTFSSAAEFVRLGCDTRLTSFPWYASCLLSTSLLKASSGNLPFQGVRRRLLPPTPFQKTSYQGLPCPTTHTPHPCWSWLAVQLHRKQFYPRVLCMEHSKSILSSGSSDLSWYFFTPFNAGVNSREGEMKCDLCFCSLCCCPHSYSHDSLEQGFLFLCEPSLCTDLISSAKLYTRDSRVGVRQKEHRWRRDAENPSSVNDVSLQNYYFGNKNIVTLSLHSCSKKS